MSDNDNTTDTNKPEPELLGCVTFTFNFVHAGLDDEGNVQAAMVLHVHGMDTVPTYNHIQIAHALNAVAARALASWSGMEHLLAVPAPDSDGVIQPLNVQGMTKQ